MRTVRAAAAITMLLLTAGGCGGGARQEARDLNDRSVIEKPRPVSEVLIDEAQIRAADTDSPERSLLRFWSNLQYQAWDAAADFYDDGLREYLGEDRLLFALANQAAYFRSGKPIDIDVVRGERGTMTHFVVVSVDGTRQPTSITWHRAGDRWEIDYHSYLDNALAQARQLDAQMEIDPLAKTPSKQALRAGYDARKLQGRYAETERAREAGIAKAERAAQDAE